MSPFDRKPVLVIGARGSVGAHMLAQLVSRDIPVHASARSPKPHGFPAGLDVRTANLQEPASLPPVFAGVCSVSLHAEGKGVEGVVDTARAAGVERIVLMSSGSVIDATSRGNAITEEHREIEEAFATAPDPTVVPIRPLAFETNSLGWAHPIRAGALSLYRPEGTTAPIQEQDVAAVAAVLGDDAASGTLAGPVRLTRRRQVAAIAAPRQQGSN